MHVNGQRQFFAAAVISFKVEHVVVYPMCTNNIMYLLTGASNDVTTMTNRLRGGNPDVGSPHVGTPSSIQSAISRLGTYTNREFSGRGVPLLTCLYIET